MVEIERLKLQVSASEFDTFPPERKFDLLQKLTKLLINENPQEAVYFGKETLHIAIKLNDPMKHVAALLTLSHAYIILSQLSLALQYAFDALKICEDQKNQEREANVINNIASIYTYSEDSDKSLFYNQRALKIHQELGNEIGIAISYINMTWCYEVKNDLEMAKNCCEKGLAICLKNKDFERASFAYANLANICIQQTKFEEAETLLMQSLQYRKGTHNFLDIANTLERLGLVTLLQGREAEAINYLEEAMQVVKSRKFLEVEFNIYEDYFKLYTQRKEHETALSYHTKLYQLKEQLWKESNLKQIESLHYFDSLDRKEKELMLAKETAEEKTAKLQGILDNMQDAFFQADLTWSFYLCQSTGCYYVWLFFLAGNNRITSDSALCRRIGSSKIDRTAKTNRESKRLGWSRTQKRWVNFLGFHECSFDSGYQRYHYRYPRYF